MEQLTAKMAGALEVLKSNDGKPVFASDIAESNVDLFEKGAASVTPLLTTLVRKGYAAKADKADRKVIDNKTGNEVIRSYTQYVITPEGAALEYEIKA